MRPYGFRGEPLRLWDLHHGFSDSVVLGGDQQGCPAGGGGRGDDVHLAYGIGLCDPLPQALEASSR